MHYLVGLILILIALGTVYKGCGWGGSGDGNGDSNDGQAVVQESVAGAITVKPNGYDFAGKDFVNIQDLIAAIEKKGLTTVDIIIVEPDYTPTDSVIELESALKKKQIEPVRRKK